MALWGTVRTGQDRLGREWQDQAVYGCAWRDVAMARIGVAMIFAIIDFFMAWHVEQRPGKVRWMRDTAMAWIGWLGASRGKV